MTELEKFREAEPLRSIGHNVLARVIREPSYSPYACAFCSIFGCVLDVKDARALRDWLTEVLP